MRGRKKRLSDEEKRERRKAAQEDYRHRVLRFNLQFNLKDAEAREWFERQEDKGEYLMLFGELSAPRFFTLNAPVFRMVWINIQNS